MSAHKLHTKVPVYCASCSCYGCRLDADCSCPACGSGLVEGRLSTKRPMRRRVVTCGTVGDVDADVQAAVDDALRRNREEALR